MASSTATKVQVFISSTAEDGDWARQLDKRLRRLNIATFLDVQPPELDDAWAERVRRAAKKSSHAVFVISRGAVRSPFQLMEVGMALVADKSIISVVAEDVPLDELFEPLTRRPMLRKQDPEEVAREIAEAIRE